MFTHAERVAYANRIHDLVLDTLGRVCIKCGQIDGNPKNPLEIDHPNGRTYDLAKLSRWRRAARWRQELARGELRVLCRSCNATDGGGRRYGGNGQWE